VVIIENAMFHIFFERLLKGRRSEGLGWAWNKDENEYVPVTQEVAGSSPVNPAIFPLNFKINPTAHLNNSHDKSGVKYKIEL